jgi:starch synthase
VNAMHRAMHIYHDHDLMKKLIQSNMDFDFSWDKSAHIYLELYRK